MKGNFLIRTATEKDLPIILELFIETILNVNSADYTQEQLKVWSSFAVNTDLWVSKIKQDYFIVAMDDVILSGFASLTNDGSVDLLYVHKDYQRKGIAIELLNALEHNATQHGLKEINTDSSITAYPFFLKNGFVLTQEYVKHRNGIEFHNKLMKKTIDNLSSEI
jgi:putative acetyltransferase